MHISTTVHSPSSSSQQEIKLETLGTTSPPLSPRMSTTVQYKLEEANTKSVTTSIKTPHSSSVKSKESDVLLSIDTCIGTLQVSKIRFFSVASLVINLSAFVILASLIIASFVLQTQFNDLWDNLDTDTTVYRQYSISAARSAVFSGNNLTITDEYRTLYFDYLLKFSNTSAKFKSLVPESVTKNALKGKTSAELDTTKAIVIEQSAIARARLGNYSYAMTLLNSNQYQTYLTSYDSEFQVIVDYVAFMKRNSQNVSTIVLSISLAVICLSLIMVIPVIVSSFIASMKKDASNTRKLNQVRAYLLMDTMDNPKLRDIFRKFCQAEMSLENFQILEKISDYKLLCEKSFEIQEFLLDSESSEGSENDKKKKKKYHEKDLYDIEKKKYEIAFEIFTDFLDVRGEKSVNLSKFMSDKVKNHLDLFATGQNEHLVDSLFDDVGSEICILMLDTHHRFKQTIAFEKQARKEVMNFKRK